MKQHYIPERESAENDENERELQAMQAPERIKAKKIKCLCGCGKYLTPNYERLQVPHKLERLREIGFKQKGAFIAVTGYGYLNNGYFNTLRCGFRWAVRMNRKQ